MEVVDQRSVASERLRADTGAAGAKIGIPYFWKQMLKGRKERLLLNERWNSSRPLRQCFAAMRQKPG